MKKGACCVVLSALLVMGCGKPERVDIQGDPVRGRRAIAMYGCGSCHQIPGVPGANGHVGPPLKGIARRGYLAGVLPNTPEHMVRWIRNPQAVDPLSAMPDMGVSEDDARDITAFLYTLK